MQGQNVRGMEVSPPPPHFECLPFHMAEAKIQCILQGNILDPRPFDQSVSLKSGLQTKFSNGKTLTSS